MFPKPRIVKKKILRNPVPTADDCCVLGNTAYAITHEVFYGTKQRQLSIKYGLQERLCEKCHRYIHANKKSKVATEMRDKHQKAFEDKYGCNIWLKVFIGVYMED